MKRIFLSISLLFTLSSPLCAQELPSSFYCEQVTTSTPTSPRITQIWVQGEKMRLDNMTDGTIFYVLEKEAYFYYPVQGVAIKIPLEPGKRKIQDPRFLVQDLKDTSPVGQEKIAGKICNIYRAYNPDNDTETRIWVWEEKKFPLKMVINSKDKTVTIEYRNIVLNSKIPERFFILPKNAHILTMSSGPEGFSMKSNPSGK